MRKYQMKGHFKGFPKLVIYHSCRFQRPLKRTHPLSESYKGKTLKSGNFCKNHISSFLKACFSSLITASNGGHCTNLGNDSARGFSDAVAGDSFSNWKKNLTSVFLNNYLFNQTLYIANRSFNV